MPDRSALRPIALRFAAGLLIAVALAEVSARVAEAAGPPALRWYDASAQLKVEQMDRLAGVEVVFAGTSMVWQGLVPAIFTAADPDGRAAYNAALAGGVPVVMEPWLLDQVVPRIRPELVVWGLSSLDFSASYGEDNLDSYSTALETRSGPLAALERSLADVSSLVRYRSILRRPSALFGESRSQLEDSFDSAVAVLGERGERRDFEADVGEERATQIASRLRDYRLDEADLAAMHRTIESLRAEGTDVILAEMPVPDRYRSLHPEQGRDLQRAHEATLAVADILGVPVVDLRRGFTDDDFVDFTHLDEPSASELTIQLVESLTAPDNAAPTRDSLIATTVRAASVHDEVAFLLRGGTEQFWPSKLWFGLAHYGQTRDLTVLADTDDLEVLFVGTSMMAHAADTSLFTELDGRTSFNVGLPGGGPEITHRLLADTTISVGKPELVVYGFSAHDVRPYDKLEGSCAMPTDEWDTPAANRERFFGPVAALTGIPVLTRLLGDPPTAEVHPLYYDRFTTGGQLIPGGPESERPPSTEFPAREWTDPFEPCAERLDQFADTVSWLNSEGIDVVIVAMPTRDTFADLFEGDRAGASKILSAVGDIMIDAGAAGFLDFSDLVPDDQFWGRVHVDQHGSILFTEQLAASLNEMGL